MQIARRKFKRGDRHSLTKAIYLLYHITHSLETGKLIDWRTQDVAQLNQAQEPLEQCAEKREEMMLETRAQDDAWIEWHNARVRSLARPPASPPTRDQRGNSRRRVYDSDAVNFFMAEGPPARPPPRGQRGRCSDDAMGPLQRVAPSSPAGPPSRDQRGSISKPHANEVERQNLITTVGNSSWRFYNPDTGNFPI